MTQNEHLTYDMYMKCLFYEIEFNWKQLLCQF